MKKNKIHEQIDPFKNHDEKGLFTFYLQTQLSPNSAFKQQPNQQSPTHIIIRQPNPLLDSKKLTPRKNAVKRKKPIKTLTEQLNEGDSINLLTKKNDKSKMLTEGSIEQIDKVKELFNFKRKSNKKMIDQFIQNHHKMSSSKSNQLQRRKIKKTKPNHNFSLDPSSINSHQAYPIDQGKQKSFFPCRSPKRNHYLEKDYHQYQNCYLPEIDTHHKVNIEHAIHQLKCQAIIQPEKFKSIMYLNAKKRHSPSIRDYHLLINNDFSNQQKISIELKSKRQIPLEIDKFINKLGSSQKISEKITTAIDHQETPFALSRFTPTKNHHLFNTLERSLISSLQKVDEQEFENDIKQLFKGNSSNLLKKRSHQLNAFRNISQFRVKHSVIALQRPQGPHELRKNDSQMIKIQDRRQKYGKNLSLSNQKGLPQDRSVKQIKHNFLQILTKMKDRYQSI